MAEGNSSDCNMESLLAAKLIAEKAKDVCIDEEGIQMLALDVIERFIDYWENLTSNNTNTYATNFMRPYTYYPGKNYVNAADWLFVLHTLNFSLWHPRGTEQWTVNGAYGFSGLCAAMKRIVLKGFQIWNPRCYTRMQQCEFEYMFRSDDGKTTLPVIHERLRILREVGQVLLNKYKGTFKECIKSSGNNANKLMKLLFDEFEPYRDEAVYEGLTVRFYNKARALIIDISTLCQCESLKIDTKSMMSTMFINYRVPQYLLSQQVLCYSNTLVTRLQNTSEPFEHGSREELEIRGCSLFAFTKICEKVQHIISEEYDDVPNMNTKEFSVPVLVDNFLFEHIILQKDKEFEEQEPFHYIRTVHY